MYAPKQLKCCLPSGFQILGAASSCAPLALCMYASLFGCLHAGLLPGSGRAVKVILGPHFKLFGNVSCAYTDRYVMLPLPLPLPLLCLPYLRPLLQLGPSVGGFLSVLGGFNILGALKLYNTMLGESTGLFLSTTLSPRTLSRCLLLYLYLYRNLCERECLCVCMCVCMCTMHIIYQQTGN